MTRYVTGLFFILGSAMPYLVLIRKKRPEWQAGKLNGVGGRLQEEETFFDAMVREFTEETGYATTDWREIGSEIGPEYENRFFVGKTFQSLDQIEFKATDEELEFISLPEIPDIRDEVVDDRLLAWVDFAYEYLITVPRPRSDFKIWRVGELK